MPEILPDKDSKNVVSENSTINWSRDQYMRYLKRKKQNKKNY